MANPPFPFGALRATLPEPTFPQAAASATQGVFVLRGRDAVAAQAEMLEDLCQRTGQAGAMHWLEFLLGMPASMEKIPALVLVGVNYDVVGAAVRSDELVGAVLLYEYQVAGMGTKVFATDDTTGLSTVIAPASLRMQVAETACQELLEQGALAAIISFAGCADANGEDGLLRGSNVGRMAKRTRSVPHYLPLAATHEATLATLGRHTRRNLRYYRRRVESELGAEFVPAVVMGREEFLAVNRASTNPVPIATAEWRYNAISRTQEAIFSGVRGHNGRWLSLIGGRRHLGMAEIDWQMNLAGLPRCSLSTVMRSYVLEHEVKLGTSRLAFTGGTPHTMRHSFVCVDAVDVIAVRGLKTGWLLRACARWIFPETNFLGQALRDDELSWTKA